MTSKHKTFQNNEKKNSSNNNIPECWTDIYARNKINKFSIVNICLLGNLKLSSWAFLSVFFSISTEILTWKIDKIIISQNEQKKHNEKLLFLASKARWNEKAKNFSLAPSHSLCTEILFIDFPIYDCVLFWQCDSRNFPSFLPWDEFYKFSRAFFYFSFFLVIITKFINILSKLWCHKDVKSFICFMSFD